MQDRVRIGVVVPSVNTVIEPWFTSVVPDQVSVHATRIVLDSPLTPETLRTMDQTQAEQATRAIAMCEPRAIAYCCTASSIILEPTYDTALERRLTQIARVPVIAAASATCNALQKLGAKRICIASPYPDIINEREARYFSRAGFEVVNSENLGIADAFKLAEPNVAALFDLACRAWRKKADVMLLSCLNTQSHQAIESLESELGVPVVTSTQATLWKLLRTCKIPDTINNFGSLLRRL